VSTQGIEIALASKTTGAARLVLLVLGNLADPEGRIDPWDLKLARRDARLQTRTLLGVLADLEQRGEIFTEGSEIDDAEVAAVVMRVRECVRPPVRGGLTLSPTRSTDVPDVNALSVVTGSRFVKPPSTPLSTNLSRWSPESDALANELWRVLSVKPLGGFVAFRVRLREALAAGYSADMLRAIAPSQRVWTRGAIELALAKQAEATSTPQRTPRYYDPDKTDANWRERVR
jgi:hypothetical protein